MRKLGIGVLALFALLLVLNVSDAEAVVGWNVTVTNGEGVTGTENLTVSITEEDITNVTFHYTLPGGNPVFIDEFVNTTANAVQATVQWDTSALTDQGPVTLNATAQSKDTVANSSATIDVDLDNTAPLATFGSTTPAAGSTHEDNTSITIDTATDASLVNCTLTISPAIGSTSTYAVTAAGSRCTQVINNVPDFTYGFTWTTNDNLNQTAGSARSIIIDNTQKGKDVQKGIALGAVEGGNLLTGLVVIAMIVGVIALVKKK